MKYRLVYDKYSPKQWERLSFNKQRQTAEEWRQFYPFNVKYWPITAGEGCYPGSL